MTEIPRPRHRLLSEEEYKERAGLAADARTFLKEVELGLRPGADPEIVELCRVIDENTWTNETGGLDERFVGRRHEAAGLIREFWDLADELRGMVFEGAPEERQQEVYDRIMEIVREAHTIVDDAAEHVARLAEGSR